MDLLVVSVAGFSELRLQEVERLGVHPRIDLFQLLVSLN